MNLVSFYSDKGRGHTHTAVYVNPEEVASVVDNVDTYSSSENKTVITLKNGQCLHVKEWSSAVVAKLAEEASQGKVFEDLRRRLIEFKGGYLVTGESVEACHGQIDTIIDLIPKK